MSGGTKRAPPRKQPPRHLPRPSAAAGLPWLPWLPWLAWLGSAPSCEAAVAARELLRLLEASTTPERWRTVVALAGGASAAELEELEGTPAGTTHSRVRLARRDMAAALAREAARAC